MKRKTIFLAGLFLLPVFIILAGCDNFYSISWGKPRKYDSDNIDIQDVEKWKDAAIGNPELADACIDKIQKEVMDEPDSEEKAKLQEAAVSFATEASGMGGIIINNVDILADLLSEIDSEDNDAGADIVADLISAMQKDFKKSKGPSSAKKLAEILQPEGGFSDDADEAPEFSEEYAEIAKPEDVVQAILLLTMAVLEDMGLDASDVFNGDFDIESLEVGLTFDGENIVVQNPKPDGLPTIEALALAAYLNLIIEDKSGKFDENTITQIFKGFFSLGD